MKSNVLCVKFRTTKSTLHTIEMNGCDEHGDIGGEIEEADDQISPVIFIMNCDIMPLTTDGST